MIDAMSTRFGNASLIRRIRGAHHSSVLSEINSQFQDAISSYLQGTPDDVFTWFAGYRMQFFAAKGLLGAALLLDSKLVRFKGFFRTVYFVPVVTSIVVVSILWRFMYQPDGLVNNLLQTLSFNVVQGTDWLNNPTAAMPAIMFMSIWQAVGFHMVIWLSGLQTIPGELYEAAELDGADKWQQFRYITWPGLKATRTFILVTITIAARARRRRRLSRDT